MTLAVVPASRSSRRPTPGVCARGQPVAVRLKCGRVSPEFTGFAGLLLKISSAVNLFLAISQVHGNLLCKKSVPSSHCPLLRPAFRVRICIIIACSPRRLAPRCGRDRKFQLVIKYRHSAIIHSRLMYRATSPLLRWGRWGSARYTARSTLQLLPSFCLRRLHHRPPARVTFLESLAFVLSLSPFLTDARSAVPLLSPSLLHSISAKFLFCTLIAPRLDGRAPREFTSSFSCALPRRIR